MKENRRPGRPVSATLEGRLFDAALALVEETRSFDGLTVDTICRRAGSSKSSFYRRWPDRSAFILQMMDTLRMPPIPEKSNASLRDDLVAILNAMLGTDQRRSRIVQSAFLAEGRKDPELIERYHRDIVTPRRQSVTRRLERAVAEGELGASVDVAMLQELLSAPALKIMLLNDPDDVIEQDFAPRLVDQLLRGRGNGGTRSE